MTFRHVGGCMRFWRTVARDRFVSGGQWRRSAGRNHQNPRHADARRDRHIEQELFGHRLAASGTVFVDESEKIFLNIPENYDPKL